MSFLIAGRSKVGLHVAGTCDPAEALVRLVEIAHEGHDIVECTDADGKAYSQQDLLGEVAVAAAPVPRGVTQL